MNKEYVYEADAVIAFHDKFCRSLGLDPDDKNGINVGDLLAPLVMVTAFAISTAPTEERAKSMLESVVRQMAHLMLAMREARDEMPVEHVEIH
jgi:hypothetical protein